MYEKLEPHSVPKWIRVNLANAYARSPKHWAELFSMHNSGTHNNQWVITDLANPHKQEDLMYLVEQMPGYIASRDVTKQFRQQGYWASYNIPYDGKIFYEGGFAASGYSYENDLRAVLIREN